jgi:CubicO group peptidase (beta-lactamase class C family)
MEIFSCIEFCDFALKRRFFRPPATVQVEASHSDGFVVTEIGQLLTRSSSSDREEAIETMSMTKSFVSLAIGFLVDDDFISSIDQPVYIFFPEWNQGLKSQVTIRHLLEHTSGLAANPTTQDIYSQPDFIRYALDSEIITPPGKVFFYNNKAVNLLVGIVEKASG